MEELTLYKEILIKEGYISIDGELLEKAQLVLFDKKVDNVMKNIENYRSIFPKGILPNGKAGRSSLPELVKKFEWFLNHYNYNWDTIFEATKQYVDYFEKQDYKFMATSSYFIYKQDTHRVKSSALSEWCDKVNDIEEPMNKFDIDV